MPAPGGWCQLWRNRARPRPAHRGHDRSSYSHRGNHHHRAWPPPPVTLVIWPREPRRPYGKSRSRGAEIEDGLGGWCSPSSCAKPTAPANVVVAATRLFSRICATAVSARAVTLIREVPRSPRSAATMGAAAPSFPERTRWLAVSATASLSAIVTGEPIHCAADSVPYVNKKTSSLHQMRTGRSRQPSRLLLYRPLDGRTTAGRRGIGPSGPQLQDPSDGLWIPGPASDRLKWVKPSCSKNYDDFRNPYSVKKTGGI